MKSLFGIPSSNCLVYRLAQVRRVHVEAAYHMLRGAGALEFITDFFPHLTHLTVIMYDNSHTGGSFMTSRLHHLYNSLVRRGVRVDAVYMRDDGVEYDFSFAPNSSQSLDLRYFDLQKWGKIDVIDLEGVTSLNIWRDSADTWLRPGLIPKEVTEKEVINVNEVLAMLASKDRRGNLTEVSMPKVNLTYSHTSILIFFYKALLLASKWASKLGGEEEVERAAVSGLQPKRCRALVSGHTPRVFILPCPENPGMLTLRIS